MTIIVRNGFDLDLIDAFKMYNYERRMLGKKSVGISLNFSITNVLCQIPFKEKDTKNQQKYIRIANKENLT